MSSAERYQVAEALLQTSDAAEYVFNPRLDLHYVRSYGPLLHSTDVETEDFLVQEEGQYTMKPDLPANIGVAALIDQLQLAYRQVPKPTDEAPEPSTPRSHWPKPWANFEQDAARVRYERFYNPLYTPRWRSLPSLVGLHDSLGDPTVHASGAHGVISSLEQLPKERGSREVVVHDEASPETIWGS